MLPLKYIFCVNKIFTSPILVLSKIETNIILINASIQIKKSQEQKFQRIAMK